MTKNKQTFSIRETAEILVPDKLGRTSYLIALLICFTMIVIIAALYSRIPSVVPLYFTLPWGEMRLTPKISLYALPVITFLCFVFNLALGRVSTKLSLLLAQVLSVSAAIVASMMLIALLGIIQSLIL
jgi:hypothetical protein